MNNYYEETLAKALNELEAYQELELELSNKVYIKIYSRELDPANVEVYVQADLVDDLIINGYVTVNYPITKKIICEILEVGKKFLSIDYSLIYAEEAEISLAKIMQLSYNNITIPYVKSLWMGEIIPAKNIREVFFNCFLIEFFDCSSFNYKEYLDENFIIKIVNTTTYDKDKIIISKNHKYLHVLDYSVNRILVNDEYYEIKTGYYLGPFYNFIKQLPFEYEYESLKKNANKV